MAAPRRSSSTSDSSELAFLSSSSLFGAPPPPPPPASTWLNSDGESDGPDDDSLTSLNWLQSLHIDLDRGCGTDEVESCADDFKPSFAKVNTPTAAVSTENSSIDGTSTTTTSTTTTTMTSRSRGSGGGDEIDYGSNPTVKPPYSYATLICMAMKATNQNKITLSSIYKWIMGNFMYYRKADPGWQVSSAILPLGLSNRKRQLFRCVRDLTPRLISAIARAHAIESVAMLMLKRKRAKWIRV